MSRRGKRGKRGEEKRWKREGHLFIALYSSITSSIVLAICNKTLLLNTKKGSRGRRKRGVQYECCVMLLATA